MADTQKRSKKLLEAALEATGGMGVEGLFRASRPVMPGDLQTPWRQRPWVLRYSRVKHAPLRKVIVMTLTAISLEFASGKIRFTSDNMAATERANRERDSTKPASRITSEPLGYYFGPAHSSAAQFLIATLPRSKARVLSLLCVTRDELMLLHVPETYRSKYFANAVDVGWRIDRKQLEWTRNSDGARVQPKMQYGFTDGSWMTLHTEPVGGQPAFTDVFPATLAKDDPIPPHPNYPAPEPSK